MAGFFVLAHLGSWIAWSPWWLSQSGIGLLPFELPFSAVAGINQLGLFAGPFTAALLLGVIHCFWHAPLFLTDEWDTARQEPSQHLAYLVLVVSLSIVLSWLFNETGGSVLLVVLGHNGLNWALFATGTLTGSVAAFNWPTALGLAGLAIIAIIATRGRLGYTGADEPRRGGALISDSVR